MAPEVSSGVSGAVSELGEFLGFIELRKFSKLRKFSGLKILFTPDCACINLRAGRSFQVEKTSKIDLHLTTPEKKLYIIVMPLSPRRCAENTSGLHGCE